MEIEEKRKGIKNIVKNLIMFIIGTVVCIPLYYIRGDDRHFINLIGGFIFLTTSISNCWFKIKPHGKELLWESLIITVLVYFIEITTRVIDVIILKSNIWTSANHNLSLWSTEMYMIVFFMWYCHVLCAIILADSFDYYYIKKYDNPPCYTFLKDKIFKLPERRK